MQMLKAVSEVATLHGIVSQTSVEESMACGIGVCMTCVMPIIGEDGVTRMLRSCVDGPALEETKFAGMKLAQFLLILGALLKLVGTNEKSS